MWSNNAVKYTRDREREGGGGGLRGSERERERGARVFVVVYPLPPYIWGGGASKCCYRSQVVPAFEWSRANDGLSKNKLERREIVDRICAVNCNSPTSHRLYLLDQKEYFYIIVHRVM